MQQMGDQKKLVREIMVVHIPMAFVMAILMAHSLRIFTTCFTEVLLLAFVYLCPLGISARK